MGKKVQPAVGQSAGDCASPAWAWGAGGLDGRTPGLQLSTGMHAPAGKRLTPGEQRRGPGALLGGQGHRQVAAILRLII